DHAGLAVGGEHRAVGLAGNPPGFEDEPTAAPVQSHTMNVEHLSLSWFAEAAKAMSKTAGGCRARVRQHPAILPWPSISPLTAGPRPALSAASLPPYLRRPSPSAVNAREPSRANFSDESRAARSASCNGPRRYAADSRATAGAARRA